MDHLEVDRRLSQSRRKMCSTWQTDQRQSIPLSSPHEILHLIRSRDILSYPIGRPCRGIMPTGSPEYIEPLAECCEAVITFASQQGVRCVSDRSDTRGRTDLCDGVLGRPPWRREPLDGVVYR